VKPIEDVKTIQDLKDIRKECVARVNFTGEECNSCPYVIKHYTHQVICFFGGATYKEIVLSYPEPAMFPHHWVDTQLEGILKAILIYKVST